MSRNKKHRPYDLPTYLNEMQKVCELHKTSVGDYEARRAVGNLHHEISTLWSDAERRLGMLDKDIGDAHAFLQDVETAYSASLAEYLDAHIERMGTIATATAAEILASDCGTSYLPKDDLVCPAFDNRGTPYDRHNDEYYNDNQAREEQGRLRAIAARHYEFLVQFKADFDYVLAPDNTVSATQTPRPV